MIKEFEKLVNDFEVQITLTKPTAQENGIKARIVFISLQKSKAILPIEVWGSVEDVENSIRYELNQLNEVKSEDLGVIVKPTKKQKEKFKKAVKIHKQEEANTKKLTTEENALREAMMKEEKAGRGLFNTPKGVKLIDGPDGSKIHLCERCDILMDKIDKSTGDCTYEDCPHGKYVDRSPKDADNYMVEEELRNNPPKPKMMTTEEAFEIEKKEGGKDPAAGYIEEQLNEDDEPEWMKAERESQDAKRNEIDQSEFQF